MKVAILGAGAIGSMFGGLLRHADPTLDVLFVGRGSHGQAVASKGHIRLLGPWGVRCVQVQFSFDPRSAANADVILVTVKSHATKQLLEQTADFIGRATVVTIQNGINDQLLLKYIPNDKLIPAMTATNIAVVEPGTVSLQLDGVTMVGALTPAAKDTAKQIQQLLSKTGLRVELTENITGVRYNKLAMNALGYTSCISASSFVADALADKQWRRTVAAPLVEESLRVLRTAGIQLEPIPGRPGIDGLKRTLKLFDTPLLGSLAVFIAKRIYNRKPIIFSLYQDLLQGRKTEVDFINGEIVRLARQHGTHAPYNELVVELVHYLEQQPPGTFMTKAEVIERFRKLSNTN